MKQLSFLLFSFFVFFTVQGHNLNDDGLAAEDNSNVVLVNNPSINPTSIWTIEPRNGNINEAPYVNKILIEGDYHYLSTSSEKNGLFVVTLLKDNQIYSKKTIII